RGRICGAFAIADPPICLPTVYPLSSPPWSPCRMPSDLFAADAKLTPYWWDQTPRPDPPTIELPQAADVVVIGSGYTGLSAALVTARAGRKTLVLDAEDAGWGCSTRNGGQISTSIKPGYDSLARRHGAETAFRIVKDGQNSLAWIGDFVAQ